ncbi:MAG: serine/threonine protein kinase [Anaerolineales bacterium]
MIKETNQIKVSSWNEWDPLKHVIVGRADGTMVQAPEIAVQRVWPEQGYTDGKYGPYPKEMTDKANEQMDDFAAMLEKRGIRVDRPTPIDFNQKVQTPDWEQDSMFGCMPPRDLLLTIGNEILEATMSYRSRWFEYLCFRPLLEKYFKEDPNFNWEAAPKPRLSEQTYKKGFWEKWNALSEEEKWEQSIKSEWLPTEVEPLFDAADVVRCGKDLFVQKSMVTNQTGINWLQRHYPDHRVHTVRYKELLPWHMDTTIVPLRPGLVMFNPGRPALEPQREFFEKNDWEILVAPKSVLIEKRPMTFCSIWLNINLLVLDPKTVCVEASETPVIELLDQNGFEVIPVPFYEVSPFGGGLHCGTADVYREGTFEDYFPKQMPGF